MDQADRTRFEAIYRDNVRQLLAYVLTRTGRDDAPDVVSSTFLVAWRRFHEVPADPLPWLIGVARRVLADQWRAESRRRALGRRLEADALSSSASLRDVADSLVLSDAIREALSRMRPHDREVVTLAAWQGFNTEQLAAALGCSKTLASLRLHRARSRFTKLFEAQPEDPPRTDSAPVRPAREVP